MKASFLMTIRDGGTSLILTVPKQVQKLGFESGDLVNVALEKIKNKTEIREVDTDE